MSVSAGDKVILVRNTDGGLMPISVYTPGLGDKCILVRDAQGVLHPIKVISAVSGDRCLLARTADGHRFAVTPSSVRMVLVIGGTFRDKSVFENDSPDPAPADYVDGERIAYYDGSIWHPIGAGFNNMVLCLASFGGSLYAGGSMTASGAIALGCIARWNGSAWLDVDGGVDRASSPHINTMVVHDGELWVGGSFDEAGGNPADCIVRWSGSSWTAVENPVQTGEEVDRLFIYNGSLYCFTHDNHRISRWDGSGWEIVESWLNLRDTPSNTDVCVYGDSIYFMSDSGLTGQNGQFVEDWYIRDTAYDIWGNPRLTYSGGLPYAPVTQKGSVVFTIPDLGIVVQDDGEGTLYGDAAGTINYLTGAYSWTVTDPPEWGEYPIYVSFWGLLNEKEGTAIRYTAGAGFATLPGAPNNFVGIPQASIVYDSKLIIGGRSFSELEGEAISGERPTWSGTAWDTIASANFPHGERSLAVCDGQLYAAGGAIGSSYNARDFVKVYDPVANSWSVIGVAYMDMFSSYIYGHAMLEVPVSMIGA